MKEYKVFFAGMAGLTSIFAPLSDVLKLLIALMVIDLVTGLTKAILKKNVQSRKMYEGIIKKVFIFILIGLGVLVDNVIVGWTHEPMILFNHEVTIRLFIELYFVLEELLSVLENMAACGLPIPKWLRNILKNTNQTLQGNETPSFIKEIIKNIFKLDNSKKDEKGENDDQ